MNNLYKTQFPIILLLIILIGCSSKEPQEVKLSPKATVVDSLLSLPYNSHFKNVQGDYSVAYALGAKIEDLKYETNIPMSLVELFNKASQLGENPTKSNYAVLQKEWERVKKTFMR